MLTFSNFAVNGNHLSNDGAFIEKRRRGLARFLNALVRHPILSQEQLVIMFMTVPTELSVWRKQATISVQDEFTGRALPPGLEDSLSPALADLFDRTRAGMRRSAELYINICSIMDRLVKRSEGVAADHARIALSLTSLIDASADTYATDTNDVPLLNDGLQAMSKHLRTSQSLMEDESRAWDEGVLEDLKRQRDALVSIRDMFDRKDRLDKDNIPYLERRIQTNETKLASLRAKPDGLVKPGEIDKVVESIIKVRPHAPPFLPYGLPYGSMHSRSNRHYRTRSPSSTSTTAPCSSRSAPATSSSTSRPRSTTCHGGTRTGPRSVSNTPRCSPTTGVGCSTSSRACLSATRCPRDRAIRRCRAVPARARRTGRTRMLGGSQPFRRRRRRVGLEVRALSPCRFGQCRALPMRLAGLRTPDRGACWEARDSNARGAREVFYVT